MNLTGQVIVSMPSLQDERFYKTVIYMCAHSSEGSMGIIINKKIDYDLFPSLLEQLGIDKPINNKLFLRYGMLLLQYALRALLCLGLRFRLLQKELRHAYQQRGQLLCYQFHAQLR